MKGLLTTACALAVVLSPAVRAQSALSTENLTPPNSSVFAQNSTEISGNSAVTGRNRNGETSGSANAVNENADGRTTFGEQNAPTLKDPKSGCGAFAVEAVEADSISWSGGCLNGLANGLGTATYSSHGKILEAITAEFDRGKIRDGHISVGWPDGSHYEGGGLAGRIEGSGVLTTTAGDRFEGQWRAGKLDGHGIANWANGDRYEGDWRAGIAEGHGTQIWADGRKYEGDWRNDLPDGHGIVTRKDGTRYEGDFSNGQPGNLQLAVETAQPETATAQAAVPRNASSSSSNISADAISDESNTEGSSVSVGGPAIEGIAGKKLFAVDGSTLALTPTEAGLTRVIVAPDGSVKTSTFSFLSDKVGSVSEGDDRSNITGVFRRTDVEVIANFNDGHSETLFPNRAGGVSIVMSTPSGSMSCMTWYPEGHRFSVEERKAALAAYATRLGLESAHGRNEKPAIKPVCDLPARHADEAAGSIAPARPVPKLSPLHRNERQADSRAASPAEGDASALATPNNAAPAPHDPVKAIDVKSSIVHTVDAGANAPTGGTGNHPAFDSAGNTRDASASSCLTIESDGIHWGFRNHCDYDVQFAYCLKNADDPLASCSSEPVSGSVAPNGKSALVVDKSLSETNGNHEFRWVACSGGAGEVIVHLDKVDPPAGRCVRTGAS